MAVHTQALIEQTFTDMLNEQMLSKITVKSLTDRCSISRHCFYYHFSGIPALLDTVAHKWVTDLIASISSDVSVEESFLSFLDAIMREKNQGSACLFLLRPAICR